MDMIPVWQQDMFVCCTWHSKHCSGKYIYLQNAITFASGKAKVYVHTHSLRHYTFLLVCRIKHSHVKLFCKGLPRETTQNSRQISLIRKKKLCPCMPQNPIYLSFIDIGFQESFDRFFIYLYYLNNDDENLAYCENLVQWVIAESSAPIKFKSEELVI